MIIQKISLIDKLAGWIMLVLGTIVVCIVAALMIFPQKSEMESTGAPQARDTGKKPEQEKSSGEARHQINDAVKMQVIILNQQIEILRLQVCSEYRIPQDECLVNWPAGIVERRGTQKK